jgi:flagellar biosynthetic protein FliR
VDGFIVEFARLFPEINLALGTGIMIFMRFLGIVTFAPFFSRREIPAMVKIAITLIMTISCTAILKPQPVPENTSLVLCMLLNFIFGWMIGYIMRCVMETVISGGGYINQQMGLMSAQAMDPSTRSQMPLMGTMFGYIGLVIFVNIGGVYWLIDAFLRSFEIFGMYQTELPLDRIMNIEFLIMISSNILYVGMQIASPILLATLGQDIILGTIARTSPQVPVFQMSFLFKPVMGATIMIWILPMLIEVIQDYITSFAQIF